MLYKCKANTFSFTTFTAVILFEAHYSPAFIHSLIPQMVTVFVPPAMGEEDPGGSGLGAAQKAYLTGPYLSRPGALVAR